MNQAQLRNSKFIKGVVSGALLVRSTVLLETRKTAHSADEAYRKAGRTKWLVFCQFGQAGQKDGEQNRLAVLEYLARQRAARRDQHYSAILVFPYAAVCREQKPRLFGVIIQSMLQYSCTTSLLKIHSCCADVASRGNSTTVSSDASSKRELGDAVALETFFLAPSLHCSVPAALEL